MNTMASTLTLQDIVDAFKPKMDGVGVVTQAHEKTSVPPSDPEHAGEEARAVPHPVTTSPEN